MPPAATVTPVIRNVVYGLAHAPDLVVYGSKPRREIARDSRFATKIREAHRSFAEAVAYPPNQVFIGGLHPTDLDGWEQPWSARPVEGAQPVEAHGEIYDQDTLYAFLMASDVLEPPLVDLTDAGRSRVESAVSGHPVLARFDQRFLDDPGPTSAPKEPPLTLTSGGAVVGSFRRDERAEGIDDENLVAHHLLENLCAKATGAHALGLLLEREGLDPDDVDFVISCGEEAVGDRYQRGGGGMAKAIAELCGCSRASGMDIKNFCAAPANAIVTAGAMVAAGLHERVVVVGGGSLAKLGMKSEPLLAAGLPVLDDCLGSLAVLVSADDGQSPVLRLDRAAVGRCPVGASTSDEAIYRSLLLEPLDALGLRIADVDRFAPELHNSEIMVHAGSGDVAAKNYRSIAAMAVLSGQLERSELESFVDRISMPGWAPTQGHIPSGVPYLGFAVDELRHGEITRAMVLSKASLFLGRCTQLYDGVSILIETNPALRGGATE